MSLLEIRDVRKTFGGLVAVDNASLDVNPGEITALIGPNGAGKTTFYNCVTGVLPADAGTVVLDGVDLSGMETHQRAAHGLGRTFQRLEVFANMSVFENLQVATESRLHKKVWRSIFKLRQRPDPEVVDDVRRIIDKLGLEDVADTRAGDLSTGRLRTVELGRALCTDPKVLLLDEPASGLDSAETTRFERVLRDLADDGLAILLVEHDVELVMDVSTDVYVLDFGRMIAHGTPDEVMHDEAVRSAYLGTDDEEVEHATAS